MKTTINIPYPVWTTLFQIKQIIETLKEVEPFFKGAPTFENSRRITFHEKGDELKMKISLWNTAGQYLDAEIYGVEDSAYGTDWHLEEITRMRWTYQTDATLRYPKKVDIKIDGELFEALWRVIDAKKQLSYVRDVNPPQVPHYEERVVEAKKKASLLARKLAESVVR